MHALEVLATKSFHRRALRWLAVSLALGTSATVAGIFVHEELRRVPVQRLAQNLERQLSEKPDDVHLRLNLARLYAMAYALKATEFHARAKGEDLEASFGPMPPHIPGPLRESPSRDHQQRAKQDLARAVKAYADVIARAPENAIARVGYAWCLEQSGEPAKAIAEYRKAVELAWPKDIKEEAFWQDPITHEAAERLITLLDPVADAKEIAALQEKQAALQKKGRMITPIAIPLGGSPDRAPVDTRARVPFDADGSGLLRRWTWIRDDAGWLVHDSDGSGRITSALQWFGTVTFWAFWRNGYEAMAALDDNGDGRLLGHELRQLAIWKDANQNGLSEHGEVRPLSAYGVVALSCDYGAGDGLLTVAQSPAGVTFADGTTRPTYDVILRAAGPPVLTLTRR